MDVLQFVTCIYTLVVHAELILFTRIVNYL